MTELDFESSAALMALHRFAMRLPEAEEGTSCVKRAYRARKKAYVYLGPDGKGGVLLHGHPNGADKRICVLTRHMKVKRLTAKQLEQMMSVQRVKRPGR